ncbi:hypothetical protein CPC08DRAFT_751209 [Agrocybe pediades]|nr:hypothetical protein CPC08DRAFT_751209 [Agrocybe pediades]
MLNARPSLLFLAAFASISLVLGDKNVTVGNTDPSITYTASVGKGAPACKLDTSGNLVGGQAGCYNFGNSTCTGTQGFAVAQPNTDLSAAAYFTFKGSAIYVTSALWQVSPIYTVTLDGQSSDVNGARDHIPFDCFNLFSKTGLDPNAEHTISVKVKEASPPNAYTSNHTTLQGDLTFSLVNFIYTTPDSESNNTATSNSTNSNNAANNSTGSNSSINSTKPSSAHAAASTSLLTLVLTLAVFAASGTAVLSF